MRILDSYTLTAQQYGGCNYTQEADGRHYYPLDLLQLRVLALGTVKALGAASLPTPLPVPSLLGLLDVLAGLPLRDTPVPVRPASTLAQSKPNSANGGWLIPHAEVVAMAKSKEIGQGLHGLFFRAFGGRHVAFIGDSTMHPAHHMLAAWLFALESGKSIDEAVKSQLLSPSAGKLTAEEALIMLREKCPDIISHFGSNKDY